MNLADDSPRDAEAHETDRGRVGAQMNAKEKEFRPHSLQFRHPRWSHTLVARSGSVFEVRIPTSATSIAAPKARLGTMFQLN